MNRIVLFLILSIPVILISWRTLTNIKSHGFYRLFSWECILWLFASNYAYWFHHPLSAHQIVSWILLLISGYFIIAGVTLMKKFGKPKNKRTEKTLYEFEKTTELIDTGIFRYIRHPLYSSPMFLTWGIYFKNPARIIVCIADFNSISLFNRPV